MFAGNVPPCFVLDMKIIQVVNKGCSQVTHILLLLFGLMAVNSH